MAELYLVAREELIVGKELSIFGESPKGRYSCVFEDNCETGYFYAVDNESVENKICDAVHIYNVDGVIDKEIPSLIEIIWSEDGLKCVLIINDFPHAVFDFEDKRGYCRTNFPPSNKKWTKFEHEWTDDSLELFK